MRIRIDRRYGYMYNSKCGQRCKRNKIKERSKVEKGECWEQQEGLFRHGRGLVYLGKEGGNCQTVRYAFGELQRKAEIQTRRQAGRCAAQPRRLPAGILVISYTHPSTFPHCLHLYHRDPTPPCRRTIILMAHGY